MSLEMESTTTTSDEINKFTRKYLLSTLDADFYASDFSERHFGALLDELFIKFGEESTRSRMKTIGTCIANHFRNFSQECEVSINKGKIKVTKKFQEGITTADMDRASIRLGRSIQGLVQEKELYALQEHLLCFPEDLLETLYQNFSSTSIGNDYKSLRNIIRPSVEQNFDLRSRDIVLFLRKKLYVRYFIDLRTLPKDENRRFLGVSPEHLEILYKENFPADFGEILLEMAPDVIEDTLDFGRIDNFVFKEKYIEVFRTLVDVAMAEYTSSIDKESVMALNGYILRLHFDSLLYLCAEVLIDMVMKRDRKADEFLRFYNGETIVGSNGKKIKKPFVVDVKENIWNYSSIFSVMTQCAQFETLYKQQVLAVKEAESQYKKAEQLLSVSKGNEKKGLEILSLLKDELHACTTEKNNLLNIKKPSKEETHQLREKRHREKHLLAEHDKAFSEKNDLILKRENAKITERNRLKQLEEAKRSLVMTEKKGDELYAQQDRIFSALAKALIFR